MLSRDLVSGLIDGKDGRLVAVALAGLSAGGLAAVAGRADLAAIAWTLGTLPVLAALGWQIAASLRRGDLGLDLIAALSMSAALTFGEPLAGNVVALMYAGGQRLESYARGRARREMTALLGRVAHTAMRYVEDRLREVPIGALAPGDRILVRNGEVVPVDGRIAAGSAVLDESALTGEPMPVHRQQGGEALSGATSVGPAFDLVVLRPAAESTYANIVRLVTAAQRSKAPMVRLADRYAIAFLVVTLVMAAGAWAASGEPLRALAVLVVATPCPLILAVPVAIISGMSRAAKAGVLVKSGAALETLAGIRSAVLDKTGTLTAGKPTLTDVRTIGGFDARELLRLAASLDQASGHVVAAALVDAARARGLRLPSPEDVVEKPGTGIEGRVEGRRVVVGGGGYVRARAGGVDPRTIAAGLPRGTPTVAVAVDGEVRGVLALTDPIRHTSDALLASLRRAGVRRIVLASGDRADVVASVASRLGIEKALGELTPRAKVEAVVAERANGPVMMVGDGVNDAPALAAADVGVAMGARGAAASSEAADVVLLVDRLDRLAEALAIARRTRSIALQSVTVGLGLSLVAMSVAALGHLPPVQGAVLQEAIDVSVILNALRALRGPADLCRGGGDRIYG
ncbi:MAG TPA: heavy metal translocating P-type ATPase [Geminicoccaceae bacterium]|nr:heavy metal translocating P-type ATPase [Geminicoccus sp.]HMU51072.1 heavy metal translocating P-type ATPase [Geminicoccaceae bacterium]